MAEEVQEPEPQGHSPQSQEPVGEEVVEVDEDAAQDSTYDSDGHSNFVSSLSSSLKDYKYENGRRYHAFRAGAYLLPNDEVEQERMDLVHHIYRLLLDGRLSLVPIVAPQRVLDLGTGTGIWAMDFADEYPSAEVMGIDLSPIQPRWTPPNCFFEVDDFEDDWIYIKPFDFIHARELEGCVKDEDKLFERARQHLIPGGLIELQASSARFTSDDGTLEKAINTKIWLDALHEASKKFGKPLDVATGWREKLENAGFVDVQEKVIKLPVGTWPKDRKLKDFGRLQLIQQTEAVDSYTPAIKKVLDWDDNEIEVLKAKVKSELKDPSIHFILPIHFVWARKP